jgi:fibronectin-binding autotransporter adhesin
MDAVIGSGTLNKGWSGDKILTIGVANGSGEYRGVIYNNRDLGYGGDAGGNFFLTKQGTGTQILGGTLGGTDAYAGTTDIQQGTLIIAGNQTSNSAVSVGVGATFGVKTEVVGTSLTVPSVTSSSSTIDIHTEATGNPTAPALVATGNFDATATTIRVTGTALTASTAIPLVQYGTLVQDFATQLTLEVPARTVATLVNNSGSSRVDLDIVSTDQVKWAGGPNWTANAAGWVLTSDGVTAASYLQGTANNGSGTDGTDVVNFDDSGLATSTVNLSGTLTPYGTTVSNTTGTYKFAGSGQLSGGGQLVKNNDGTLVVANTANNDYSGGTVINGGTLRVGDGTTAGAGTLGYAAITNNATLVLDRPDDFTLGQNLIGTGSLVKENSNTVTVTNAATYGGTVTINAGRIKLPDTKAGNNYVINSGGSLELAVEAENFVQFNNGSITGTGNLVKTGPGWAWLGAADEPQTIALSAGSVIDIQGGVLRNEYGNTGWANNKASLNVGLAGVFDNWDGETVVDFLSGSGRINQAWDSAHSLTYGINNGSGTFSGIVTNIGLGYGESTANRALKLIKEGAGTQIFSGQLRHSGGMTVNGGNVTVNGLMQISGGVTVNNGTMLIAPTGGNDSVNYSGNNTIAAGATLKFDFNGSVQRIKGGTLSGAGNFIKTGTGTLQVGDNGLPMNVSLDANVVIDVQQGALKNDWGNGNGSPGWQNNKAGLSVAAGAFFDVWDGAATVAYLTGAGTVQKGNGGTSTLTVGANDGSGTFTGTIGNPGAGTFPGGDGYGGGGTLNVAKTGTGTQTINGNTSYSGTTTIDGGTWVLNGTHAGKGTVSVASGATLSGNATINLTAGAGDVLAAASSTISPGGAGVGTLAVSLNSGQMNVSAVNAGGLKFDLGDPGVSSASDRIVFNSGTLSLGSLDFGDFAFNNAGGVGLGQYTLFDSAVPFAAAIGTASGTFAGFTATLSLDNTNFDVLLTLTPGGLAGDYNSDGKVDAADYVVWRKNPTVVGGGDPIGYNTWRANFGNPPGSGSGSGINSGTSVPEPATLSLAGTILALTLLAKSRKRRV